MDYAALLKALLRPLGLYAVDTGIGGAELDCIGAELDRAYAALERAEQNASPLTADADGLRRWESLLPFAPLSRTIEERRAAVAALLRIDGTSFTLAALNSTLAGCGIPAVVRETETPQQLSVRFPGTRGAPQDFGALKEKICQILPCHLEIVYELYYLFWLELETLYPRWSALNAARPAWEALERQGGET